MQELAATRLEVRKREKMYNIPYDVSVSRIVSEFTSVANPSLSFIYGYTLIQSVNLNVIEMEKIISSPSRYSSFAVVSFLSS